VWVDYLKGLQEIPYKQLVPGHGPVVGDARAIQQTRGYLEWLESTLQRAAESGEDMAEVMATPIPKQFADIPLVHHEFARSVTHLFPAKEQQVLRASK
jgi:uncharacterized sulfatase